MVGCAIGSKDKVCKQISSLFFIKTSGIKRGGINYLLYPLDASGGYFGLVFASLNRQTNRQNYTNFESNLATMVIYLPVKSEFDWTKHFRVKVWKRKCSHTDIQIERHQTYQSNRRVGYSQPT